MALKPQKITEVRHIILSNGLEQLNQVLLDFLNSGYSLLETKVLQADHTNKIYTIFYILVKYVKESDAV